MQWDEVADDSLLDVCAICFTDDDDAAGQEGRVDGLDQTLAMEPTPVAVPKHDIWQV
jgi:hypothetical protein